MSSAVLWKPWIVENTYKGALYRLHIGRTMSPGGQEVESDD